MWVCYPVSVLGLRTLRSAVQKGRWMWSRGKTGQSRTTKTNWNPQQSLNASKLPTSTMCVTCWHTSLQRCSWTWPRIQRAKEEVQWEVDRAVSLRLPKAKVGHETWVWMDCSCTFPETHHFHTHISCTLSCGCSLNPEPCREGNCGKCCSILAKDTSYPPPHLWIKLSSLSSQ